MKTIATQLEATDDTVKAHKKKIKEAIAEVVLELQAGSSAAGEPKKMKEAPDAKEEPKPEKKRKAEETAEKPAKKTKAIVLRLPRVVSQRRPIRSTIHLVAVRF